MHSFKRIIIIIPGRKSRAPARAELGLRYNFYFNWTQCLRSGCMSDDGAIVSHTIVVRPG